MFKSLGICNKALVKEGCRHRIAVEDM